MIVLLFRSSTIFNRFWANPSNYSKRLCEALVELFIAQRAIAHTFTDGTAVREEPYETTQFINLGRFIAYVR